MSYLFPSSRRSCSKTTKTSWSIAACPELMLAKDASWTVSCLSGFLKALLPAQNNQELRV